MQRFLRKLEHCIIPRLWTTCIYEW